MSSAASGTPKWPGDHAEKHRQAALLGWARKRGFTRDTVKRGRRKPAAQEYLGETVNYGGELMSRGEMIRRLQKAAHGNQALVDRYLQGHELANRIRKQQPAPKAPPSRGMELARQVRVSAQRTRPAAHPDYSPHAGNVARLTLMHELGMEQDAAKRAKIRRELRKLGVPSDQIPKEPRKPRERTVSAATFEREFLRAWRKLENGSGFARIADVRDEVIARTGISRATFQQMLNEMRDRGDRGEGRHELHYEMDEDRPENFLAPDEALKHSPHVYYGHPYDFVTALRRKEPRKPRAPREGSAAVSQPKAARKRGGGAS